MLNLLDLDDTLLEQDCKQLRLAVVEVNLRVEALRLYNHIVIQDGGLSWVLCSTQVYLFIVDHDQNLPSLTISGHTSEERSPISIAELTVVDFPGADNHQFVHANIFFGIH